MTWFLRRFCTPSLAICLLATLSRIEAAPECRDDLREADGYRIRSVKVEGRWTPALALPIKPGDRYTNEGVMRAMETVRKTISSDANKAFELQNLGSVGVLHVTRCLMVEDKVVDVIIQPRYLRVDLLRGGSNVLPIPRSIWPTFFEGVPRPLLAFNPTIGAYQDKRYGFAPTVGIATELLHLSKTLAGEPQAERGPRLQLFAAGRKSMEESFYQADSNLSFEKLRLGEFVQRLAWEVNYQGKEEPRGSEVFSRQAFELGGSVRLKPSTGTIRTVSTGVKVRFSDNRFATDDVRANAFESALEVRMIAEGRLGGGFVRTGIWADGAVPDQGPAFARVAGLVAFEKEFLVADNQTVGLEAVLGAGTSWGAPAYARFYGGNTDRSFLYDSLDSPAMNAFPGGPWIRSFGEGQALTRRSRGADGAASYWHLNLSISLPIPGLSRPLIPNEEVSDDVTLKQFLKNKAGDSVSFYAAQLNREGLSREEAMARAEKTYGEVKPAVEFIADRADIYSIKPLLMCDLAGSMEGDSHQSTRVAVGGGLQVTVVTAKFEIGYMRTVCGDPDGNSGNFIARLVFQNLF